MRPGPAAIFVALLAARAHDAGGRSRLVAAVGRIRLKIDPSFGQTSREGHNIVDRSAPTWEAVVFAFLDAHLER